MKTSAHPLIAGHPLIAITGPTGSGKSALALFLASKLKAEIVNCDSLQLYRHFDIGTAKASREERAVVPHHLFDVLDADEICTAGDYARMARRVVGEIASRGNLPIVAGGTGLYLRALLDGLFEGPQRDDALREVLAAREQKRAGFLHRLLRLVDRQASLRIHANDKNKLIRALEICLVTRTPVTELHREGSNALEGYRFILIGLDPPRDVLYHLLNQRCIRMFEQGLLDEVRAILAMGYTREAKPFESLGYRQALEIIHGERTFADALEDMQKETRRYAKRQLTWFKKDTRVSWISGFGHSPAIQHNALETVVNCHPVKEFLFH